ILNRKGSNTRKVDVAALNSVRLEIDPGDIAGIIHGYGNHTTSASAPTPPVTGTVGGSLRAGMFRENLSETAIQLHAGERRRRLFASGRYNNCQQKRHHHLNPF
ncbi:MAG: hypothetical protein WBW76_11540, partial [Candidatus Cybelea sp.]